MIMDNNKYYCQRLRLLTFLISKGFKEYTVIPDPTSRNGYNWFVFDRSDEFDAAIDEYFAQFRKF